jgi:hypothetical protein
LLKKPAGARQANRKPALGFVGRDAAKIMISINALVEFEPRELVNQWALATDTMPLSRRQIRSISIIALFVFT